MQNPIRRGYFPEDAESAFSRWMDTQEARVLTLTSLDSNDFERLARVVWLASWRARGYVVYGLPDELPKD